MGRIVADAGSGMGRMGVASLHRGTVRFETHAHMESSGGGATARHGVGFASKREPAVSYLLDSSAIHGPIDGAAGALSGVHRGAADLTMPIRCSDGVGPLPRRQLASVQLHARPRTFTHDHPLQAIPGLRWLVLEQGLGLGGAGVDCSQVHSSTSSRAS